MCGVSTIITDKDKMRKMNKKPLFFLISLFVFTQINAQTWNDIFFDDFSGSDGLIGANYTSFGSGVQSSLQNSELEISANQKPAYWGASYINGINDSVFRVSCNLRSESIGYSFTINAKDDGVNAYSAGIITIEDSLVIYKRDYTGNLKKLATKKANFEKLKNYHLEFTLNNSNLSFKFVEVGSTDTIKIEANDSSLNGTRTGISCYFYEVSKFNIDNLKIENFSYLTKINEVPNKIFFVTTNLTSDKVIIYRDDNSDAEFIMYNLAGQVLRSEILRQKYNEINIEDLKCGLYFVKIHSSKFIMKQKLLIQR